MRKTLLALLLATAVGTSAQVTIVDHITAVANNVVTLPDALRQRLVKTAEAPEEPEESREEVQRPQSGRMAGYRVQVFSDNNQRTAKSEAGSKQRVVAARFPQYQTYVNYNAPYWRLRVGDFRTQQEANSAAEELRKAFPKYSKEIRVVRDRVNIAN